MRYPVALRSLGGKQWTRTTGLASPHLFSKQRLFPDRIIFREMNNFALFKGPGESRTHSVKELRFYRPLSTPIEADPFGSGDGGRTHKHTIESRMALPICLRHLEKSVACTQQNAETRNRTQMFSFGD